MTWEDKLESDIDGFFEEAATIKYTPSTSAHSTAFPKDIEVLIYETGEMGIQGEIPVNDKLTIMVRTKDMPELSFKDTFLIPDSSGDDEKWFVNGYEAGGHYNKTWTIELSKSSRD